jgi:hypothetical protein
MNTKPMVPPSLYLASGFIGGFIAVLLTIVWYVAVDLILDPGLITRPLAFVFNPTSVASQPVWPVIVPAALLSAILGVLLARKTAEETPLPTAILLPGCLAGKVGSFAAAIWSFCLAILLVLSL